MVGFKVQSIVSPDLKVYGLGNQRKEKKRTKNKRKVEVTAKRKKDEKKKKLDGYFVHLNVCTLHCLIRCC